MPIFGPRSTEANPNRNCIMYGRRLQSFPCIARYLPLISLFIKGVTRVASRANEKRRNEYAVMGKPMRYTRLVGDDDEEDDEDCDEQTVKGYVPILVGGHGNTKMERFLIHTNLFSHPHFMALLEMAAHEFGYEQQGILKLPCDVDHFHQVIRMISAAK